MLLKFSIIFSYFVLISAFRLYNGGKSIIPQQQQILNVSISINSCICVNEYLCDQNLVVITTGSGIINERIVNNTTTKTTCQISNQVCCRLPKGLNYSITSEPPSSSEPSTISALNPSTTTLPSEFSPTIPSTKESVDTSPTSTSSASSAVPRISSSEPNPDAETIPTSSTAAATMTSDASLSSTTSSKLQCGQQFITNRETEPLVSSFGEFPWMLALLDFKALSTDGTIVRNAFICGASLLSSKVALTAAHCIKERSESNFLVRAGEWHTLFANESLPHQDRSVRKIYLHPDFNNRTLYNDIAILRLDKPFIFAKNVFPVCLPQQDATFSGSECVASGWGRDSFGPAGRFQTTLRKVKMPVIERGKCQEQLRQTRLTQFFILHPSFVCAGGQENLDTCTGDGGGPLVCKDGDSDAFVQVGIVSWGIGCGQKDVPGVYADVTVFRSWIDATKYQIERLT